MPPSETKTIDNIISAVESTFGKGAAWILSKNTVSAFDSKKWWPTGHLSIDFALGYGIPRGRIMEVYGPESSGKTTFCLFAAKACQTSDPNNVAAIIDLEQTFDISHAEMIGVNLDRLIVSQPDTAEKAFEMIELLSKSGVQLIIVDSVPALQTNARQQADYGDATMADVARFMSSSLPKLNPVISQNGTTIIFTNQIRQKIGVMFGSPETTPGGNTLKFAASVRIDLRKQDFIIAKKDKKTNKDDSKDDDIIGQRCKLKVVKNKVAMPFKRCSFEIYFSKGIIQEYSLIHEGLRFGVISRSGTWFSFGNDRLGQGIDNAANTLMDNVQLAEKIKNQIISNRASGIESKETLLGDDTEIV